MSTKNIEIADVKDFLQVLFKHCREKATGTFFLVTDKNRAIQLVLEQGKLTGYMHGQEKGLTALAAFKNMTIKKFSFSNNSVILPASDAKIEDSNCSNENFRFH